MNELILKFEQMKTVFNRKISTATTENEEQKLFEEELSPIARGNNNAYFPTKEEIAPLKIIFSNLRYVLARFGRFSNYINKLKQGWKGH